MWKDLISSPSSLNRRMRLLARLAPSRDVPPLIDFRSLLVCLLAALFAITAGCSTSSRSPRYEPNIVVCGVVDDAVELVEARPRVRIAVVGDIGEDALRLRHRTMAQLAAALDDESRDEPLDAILILGDNFYNCGLLTDDHWEILRPLARLGIPMFPVWGNHDYGLHPGCPPVDPCRQLQAEAPDWLRPLWRFPAPSYRIEFPAIATVSMLDTTPLALGWVDSGALQQRLQRDLGDVLVPWKIAGGHHVLFSSGRHGIRRDELRRVRLLRPTLRELEVDVFVSGHDHHLELVRREGDPIYLISGSGSRTRGLQIRTAGSQVRAKQRGYAMLDLTNRSLSVSLHRLDGTVIGEPIVLLKSATPRATGSGAS